MANIKQGGRKYHLSQRKLAMKKNNSSRQDQMTTVTGSSIQPEGVNLTTDRVADDSRKSWVFHDISDKGNLDFKIPEKSSKTSKQEELNSKNIDTTKQGRDQDKKSPQKIRIRKEVE